MSAAAAGPVPRGHRRAIEDGRHAGSGGAPRPPEVA